MEKEHQRRNRPKTFSLSRLDKALRSLEGQDARSVEQMRQLKEMMEMDRSVRSLESTLAGLYSRVTFLEKTIADLKEQWGVSEREA